MSSRNALLGNVIAKLAEQMNGDPKEMILDFRSVQRGLHCGADFTARDLVLTFDTLDDQELQILAFERLIITTTEQAADLWFVDRPARSDASRKGDQ